MAKTKTSFKPGQVANPSGRPRKGESITEILRASPHKAAIVERLEQLALKGDVAAIKYFCDRLEGSPRQAMTLSGDKDAPPVQINILGVNPTENAQS